MAGDGGGGGGGVCLLFVWSSEVACRKLQMCYVSFDSGVGACEPPGCKACPSTCLSALSHYLAPHLVALELSKYSLHFPV